MTELRLVGGTLIEQLTAQCTVGIHPRIAVDYGDADLLGRCVVCGFEWRVSAGEAEGRWCSGRVAQKGGHND